MKPRWCFDTSALISLGYTNMMIMVAKSFEIVVSQGIVDELEQISKIDDDDGSSAKRWLALSSTFSKVKTDHATHAEEELHQICLKEGNPLVTDDLAAMKLFQKNIVCLFSVHTIYYLYKVGRIDKDEAIISTEIMRKARSWKDNQISITARRLYEKK